MYVMSRVRPSDCLWHYMQTSQPDFFIPAMCIGTIDFYQFILVCVCVCVCVCVYVCVCVCFTLPFLLYQKPYPVNKPSFIFLVLSEL